MFPEVSKGVDDRLRSMAQKKRAPGTDVVDIAVPIDVRHPSAFTFGDETRRAADPTERPNGRVHAAGRHLLSASEELFRTRIVHDSYYRGKSLTHNIRAVRRSDTIDPELKRMDAGGEEPARDLHRNFQKPRPILRTLGRDDRDRDPGNLGGHGQVRSVSFSGHEKPSVVSNWLSVSGTSVDDHHRLFFPYPLPLPLYPFTT